MVKEKDLEKLGTYAFLIGVIIAVIAGLISLDPGVMAWITLVLVVLGLVIGFANVKDKEISAFLITAIALMVAGSANLTQINLILLGLGTVIQNILSLVVVFVAPAAVVVALKGVYQIAHKL